MLTVFKNFEKMMDSFKFDFEINSFKPEKMFKNVKYEKTEETGSDDNSTWKSEKWSSEAGNISYYKKVTTYKPQEEKQPTLEELQSNLDEAVKEQKFELAIKLRDKIKNIEKKGEI